MLVLQGFLHFLPMGNAPEINGILRCPLFLKHFETDFSHLSKKCTYVKKIVPMTDSKNAKGTKNYTVTGSRRAIVTGSRRAIVTGSRRAIATGS